MAVQLVGVDQQLQLYLLQRTTIEVSMKARRYRGRVEVNDAAHRPVDQQIPSLLDRNGREKHRHR